MSCYFRSGPKILHPVGKDTNPTLSCYILSSTSVLWWELQPPSRGNLPTAYRRRRRRPPFPCLSLGAWRTPLQHRSCSSPASGQAHGRGHHKRRRRSPGCTLSATILRIVSAREGRRRSSADLVLRTPPLDAGRGCGPPRRRRRPSEAAAHHAAVRSWQGSRQRPWGGRGGEGILGVAGWIGETPARVEAGELCR
jgi:hypothetical protein